MASLGSPQEKPDPLDRIEAAVVRWCSDPTIPDNAIPATPDDVLALVEVARAARDLGPILQGERLAAALARLERADRLREEVAA